MCFATRSQDIMPLWSIHENRVLCIRESVASEYVLLVRSCIQVDIPFHGFSLPCPHHCEVRSIFERSTTTHDMEITTTWLQTHGVGDHILDCLRGPADRSRKLNVKCVFFDAEDPLPRRT